MSFRSLSALRDRVGCGSLRCPRPLWTVWRSSCCTTRTGRWRRRPWWSAVVAAVRAGADAAVPVVEVTETVKEVDADGRIVRTVPRDALVQLQYPAGGAALGAAAGRVGRRRAPGRSRCPARRTRSRSGTSSTWSWPRPCCRRRR